jgi:protein-tyrosine-phosphatase
MLVATSMARVLFVCQHGAAKSVIAAALCRHLAAEAGLALDAVARGTEPEAVVAPGAAAGLLAEGIELGDLRPEPVTADDVRAAWRVVSFGPDVPGAAAAAVIVERWTDVPAVSDGYEAARSAIAAHLRQLIAEAATDAAQRQAGPRTIET